MAANSQTTTTTIGTPSNTTFHHGVGSPIANNLAKGRGVGSKQPTDHSQLMPNLLDANQITAIRPNNYSMYNGQVWFEPNGSNLLSFRQPIGGAGLDQRRASSAPSGGGNSLDSALHSVMRGGGGAGGATWAARNGQGQFFPNTLGYTRNVASIAANQPDAYSRMVAKHPAGRSSRKVAPMPEHEASSESKTLGKRSRHQQPKSVGPGHSNQAFVEDDDEGRLDLEAGRSRRHRQRKQSSLDSIGSSASTTGCSTADEMSMEAPASSSVPAAEMSVELDSDQELLGFDSTGTPIIATHTRSTSIKPIVVNRRDGRPVGSSSVSQLSQSRETVAQTHGDTDSRDEQVAEDEQAQDGAAVAPTKAEASSTEQTKSESREQEENEDEVRQKQIELPLPTAESEQKGEANGGGTSISNNNKSTKVDIKKKPQLSPMVATSPLMSELTERISGRRGSANSSSDVVGASTSVAAAGGAEQQTAAGLASTSASNKRQLMLGQQQQQQGKTTKSPSRALKTLTRSETQASEQSATTDCDRSSLDTISISSRARELASMKNGELLEKKSIFAMTYSGLATDKLPD